MENGKGNKERRGDVYRIVQVCHEHDGPKENGGDDENITQGAPFPKNKPHEKRQAGVSREEKVVAEGERFEESRRGAVVNASGYRSEMSQSDKAGADDDEKGGGFEDERDDFRLLDAKRGNE